jgi:hypothetical protein
MRFIFFFFLFAFNQVFGQEVIESDSVNTDSSDYILSDKLSKIPTAFFKITGINRLSITTKDKNFASGCVVNGIKKSIKLDYVKTNKRKNTQIISLTFGGKTLYTKIYYLSYKNGVLKVKEKQL